MTDAAEMTIEKLNLRLPEGFGSRADAIARAAVKQLKDFPAYEQANIRELNIANIHINASESNASIARKIAKAVGTAVNRQAVISNWNTASGDGHATD